MTIYRTITFERTSRCEKEYIELRVDQYNRIAPEKLKLDARYNRESGKWNVSVSEQIGSKHGILSQWEKKHSLDWVEGNYRWTANFGPYSL